MEDNPPDCSKPAPRFTRGRLPLPAAVIATLMAVAAIFLSAAPPAAADESASAPGAPTGLVVAPGNGKLVAGWSLPESNGGADITSYTVQYRAWTAADWVTAGYEVMGTDTEISGLTNGLTYDVRVRAANDVGDGPWSGAASATPEEDIVWAAILTVDVHESTDGERSHGCIDSELTWDDIAECRTALTEDEFEFDGATYRWTSLLDLTGTSHHTTMGFDTSVPSDSGLRTGTLQIADQTVYLGEADVKLLRWFDEGDGWVVPRPSSEAAVSKFFRTEGQRLPMSLKATIPSGNDPADDDQDAEDGGTDPADDDQDAEVGGTGPADDDQDAEDGGTDPADDDQDAEVGGTDPADDDQDAEVGGTDPADEDQDAQRGGTDDWCPGSDRPTNEGINVCRGHTLEGAKPITILIKLPRPAPAGGTIINIATGPNQTASSDDFTLSTTAIAVAEGGTSGLLTIAAIEDDEDEGHESIHVYVCASPGCDPLNPREGEKVYNHGFVIIGTRIGGV